MDQKSQEEKTDAKVAAEKARKNSLWSGGDKILGHCAKKIIPVLVRRFPGV